MVYIHYVVLQNHGTRNDFGCSTLQLRWCERGFESYINKSTCTRKSYLKLRVYNTIYIVFVLYVYSHSEGFTPPLIDRTRNRSFSFILRTYTLTISNFCLTLDMSSNWYNILSTFMQVVNFKDKK